MRAACLVLVAMICLVSAQVFFRYVLNLPITWSEELATYLFAWLIFLGATVSIRRNEAPALNLLGDRLPRRAASVLHAVRELLALAISAALLWKGIGACIDMMAQRSPTMQVPMGIPLLVVPIAAAGLVLHYVARIVALLDAGWAIVGGAALVVGVAIVATGLTSSDWPVPALLLAIAVGFAVGLPVALALIWAVGFVLLMQDQSLLIVPEQMFTAASNFILTAIPFFMFTGAVMQVGGLADRLVTFAAALVGRFRGGLLFTNIIASAIFADMSGSAVSDTVAIGSVMLPGMIRRGVSAGIFDCVAGRCWHAGRAVPTKHCHDHLCLGGEHVSSGHVPGEFPARLPGVAVVCGDRVVARCAPRLST